MTALSKGIGTLLALAVTLVLGVTAIGTGTAQAAPQYTYGCDFCHTMPPRDSGTAKKDPFTGGVPGNHLGHATKEVSSCVPCHGDVTGYTNAHRNKVIELSDTIGYELKVPGVFLNQTSVPRNPLGTCNNVACHSDGKGGGRTTTPSWGSNPADTDCYTCHDSMPNSGKHFVKHAAYYGSGTGSCVKCHSDHLADAKPFSHATSAMSATKRDIDVRFAASPNNGGSYDNKQLVCSNIYCHSDGKGNYKPANWTTSATLDCSGCHGSATSGTLSAKHGKHINSANYGCVECHSSTVSDNSTIADIAVHVNGTVDVGGKYTGTVAAGSCSTSYCHSDGRGTYKPVTWTQSAAVACNSCHGSSGNPTGAPADNSHTKHASSAGDCVNCHSKTTVTGTTIVAGGQHIDGFMNFTSGNGKTFGKQPNKTCSNISCHSGNNIVKNVAPAQWGTTLGCNGCHATLSASHTAHTGLYGCTECHSSTVSSNTIIANQAIHMDNVAEVVGLRVTYTKADESCATSCHMSVVPKWDQKNTGTCGTCHAATSPLISTNGHPVHFTAPYGPKMAVDANSCAICHVYNGETAAPHADGRTDMQNGYPATGACSACHKQSSTNWYVADTVTCESCHSTAGGALSVIGTLTAPDVTNAPRTGHGRSGIDKTCADCHDKNSDHINNKTGDKRLLTALGSGTDNTECNYCHADANKVSAKNLNIKTHRLSGSGSLCADCHNVHGTQSNTMMVKETISGTAVSFTGNNTFANDARTGVCQVCHTSTAYFTKAGQPQKTHVDSTVNCLTCHSHNPTSGTAFAANGACDACHGYPPAPRNTIFPVTFGVQGNWSSARFEDYSGGGGAHVVEGHVPKDLRLTGTAADWTPCLPCHYDAVNSHQRTVPLRDNVENVTVSFDPQFRFSPDYQMKYSSASLVSGGANKSGTCFNMSCHMGPTKKWSIER